MPQFLALITAAVLLVQPSLLAARGLRASETKTSTSITNSSRGSSKVFVEAPSPFASTTLVINEIDYDQTGTDASEFVELKNVSGSAINLDPYSVEMVNGNAGGAAIYDTINLPNVNLAAGDYYVICANAGTVINCDLDDGPDTNFIQNGNPDAVGLRDGTTLIDAVSYGGNTGTPYTEGTGVAATDGTTANVGLSRFADGADTDDNNVDLSLRCITPGTANVAANSTCPTPVALPNLTITDVTANETNAGTTIFNFQVNLSAPAGPGGVTFDIATADGTAQDDNPAVTEDNDYVGQSLTGQTIAAGNASFPFNVTVNGDGVVEPTENFFVNVTNVTGANLTDGQGQGTITNDDSPNLSINDVTQNEGSGGGTTSFTFTVSLSTSVHSGVTFDIATADGTAQDDNPATEDNDYTLNSLTGQTIPNGSDSYQFTVNVNADSTVETNETFFVNLTNIVGAAPGDTQGQGTITNDDTDCGGASTSIHDVQGPGADSPLDGTIVTIDGIVTAVFLSTGVNGFYVQEPDADADANPNTSEGIFVFDGSFNASVAVGDSVRVTGTVDEFNNLTEITSVTSVVVCSTGNSLPAAITYDLPEPIDGDLERVENMLVTFSETLTVSGNFTLGRFGELVLSSDGRMFHQNASNAPGSTGSNDAANLNLRRYVLLDDGDTAQNPDPTSYFDAVPTRRLGDTVTGLTGILTFAFSEYRVQPIPTAAPVFVSANPRPAAHDPVGGNLEVASFNVLNYFNGDGAGGGFPTSRGADSATEFTRQRNKIIAAMIAINADVFGVIEMENDGNGSTSAIQDLVNGLNAVAGAGTYAFTEGTTPGTDEIKNSIIYKPASVTTVGAAVNDVDSVWGQARNPLAQTFSHNGNSEVFTFIVNHFTSKGCSASDTGGDADTGDGQGCDSLQRTLQANRLLTFVQARKTASGDNDVLVMGDLNAEPEEPPVTTLETDSSDVLVDGPGGLVNQVEKFVPAASRYSLQFDSRSNLLDHALTTKELNSHVSGTTIWHINADEPIVLDYNVEFKSVSQQAINVGTAYKSSDHDPVIVGLNLSAVQPQPAGQVIISEFRFRGPGGALPVTATVKGRAAPELIGPTNQAEDEFIEIYNNSNSDITVSTTDGSAGWAVVAADGVTRFIIPNNTVIPARGHFLGVNTDGYSLANYGGLGAAAGDSILLADGVTPASGYTQDIPDGSGIALFRSANSANFTLADRLDAAGYTGVPSLYREGTGFPTGGAETTGALDYTFFRTMTRATGGLPKDTGDNTADFFLADTVGTDFDLGPGTNQRLGAPGPENLSSPINRTAEFGLTLLDQAVSAESIPNRERNTLPVPNGNFGTLTLRRTFTNNTGQAVNRLRFRIVEVTTLPSPTGSGLADLRALTSSDDPVCVGGGTLPLCTGGTSVVVRGTTLEQPPTQSIGGGWNASLNVPNIGSPPMAEAVGKVSYDTPTTGTIVLSAPLNNGEAINVQFKLGVMQTGRFFFYLNIEASPGSLVLMP